MAPGLFDVNDEDLAEVADEFPDEKDWPAVRVQDRTELSNNDIRSASGATRCAGTPGMPPAPGNEWCRR